ENNLPVTMTLQGLGAFPGTHDLSLGMLGMHGTYWANQAVNNCDVLVSLGARFDDRVTGRTDTFAKNAYKIHVDIDPTAIDKNIYIDLPVVGDVKQVITELRQFMSTKPQTDQWWEQIKEWEKQCPLSYKTDDGKLRAEYVLEKISNKTKGEAVVVSDVGQHQMWTAQYYKFNHPRSHLTSGGLGTMGFSVPASIGASFGVKDRPVISISGDGGFQMNMQELITAVYYKTPIKFVIINNCYLGMVRQWQELFHAEKYSFTNLGPSNPDFAKLGEALGLTSFKTDNPDEVDHILDQAFEINDGPVLIEFKVVREDIVIPMVPSGASITEMLTEKPNKKEEVAS
ncbi:MAG: acetolactate synthase large subunit, partial [Calditrichia bacterium]|nr:acetolactate synthase large subunit [Calditrichia bacterium]